MYVRCGMISVLLAVASLLGGCATQPPRRATAAPLARVKEPGRVWVVSNRFHTSVAVTASDAPRALQAAHPKARYFIIGWGGRDLYMMRRVLPWQWITSIIIPTASALHVIPVERALTTTAPNSEIIEFQTSVRGRSRLQEHLRRAFARNDRGEVRVVGEGKTQISRFYAATETYYLPKTCNLWASSVLRRADVDVGLSFSAWGIISEGEKRGKRVGTYRPPSDPL
jgi:uncharacterized protein (TIGR02117 family)